MKQTVLDRAITWIAPAAGLRRLRQRRALDELSRVFDAANAGRGSASWRPPSTSADAEIAAAGPLLRNRMRDLVRNNPHAANALSVLVTHAIGTGIVPRTKDKKVNDLFKQWVNECDADGALNFYGIQALAVRGMFESGDGVVRRRVRRASDGLTVPLQLQVLAGDLIDATKNGDLGGGRTAIQGIEFDAIGKRTAYWIHPQHPGNSYFIGSFATQSKPIPASDIAHVYERSRPQVRGTPWGTAAIIPLFDLRHYEDAELMRKRLEACMVGVVTGGDDDQLGTTIDAASKKAGVYDASGAAVEKFEPGMFLHAHGGKEIKFNQPASAGGYDAYKESMLHTIAAGFRVPHALLTGRLDKVNYASSKVGLEHFKKVVSEVQWNYIIPMLCEPIWKWFLDAAYLAGKIDSMDHPAKWSPPRFYSADPERDTKALMAEVRAGLKPLSAAIAEMGYDRDEIFKEYEEDNKLLDKFGLVFDSDPRRMSGNGQTQSADLNGVSNDNQNN